MPALAPASGPAWVVVPTYNEADNLRALVTAVLAATAAEAEPVHVLVVDDASPDGTGAIADELTVEHDRVHVLHRAGKEGLGPAYVAGFGHALAQGAALVCEMDADLSHDPAALPALLHVARTQADVVLGSRYVPGGGVENWALHRRAISRFGCWYARSVLRVPVRDLTGGFKCLRASALEAIDYATVRSRGYAFQIELTTRALHAGLRVAEVPITFRERREGHSKMSGRITVEAVLLVPSLRRPRVARVR